MRRTWMLFWRTFVGIGFRRSEAFCQTRIGELQLLSPSWPSLENFLPNSDFVIEGYVDPREPLRDEGPFGDHTGTPCPSRIPSSSPSVS